jgi:hypothetical protein
MVALDATTQTWAKDWVVGSSPTMEKKKSLK